MKVAVVGAGISGCLLADFLYAASIDVSIFEKSRDCGGRISTMQTNWGRCDLGATIVPAQKAQFSGFMQGLCNQNIVSKWPDKIFVSQKNEDLNQSLEYFVSDREYYVFNNKIDAACRLWVKNAKLYTNSFVSQVRYIVGKGWQIKSNASWQSELFDKVILTAPWPQSQALIEQSELPINLPDVSQSWTSCWSIALKLEQTVQPEVDLVYLKNQSLQTLVRDSGKPLQSSVLSTVTGNKTGNKHETWVAQLTNKLSDDLGEQGKDKAVSVAIEGICKLFKLPTTSVSDTYAHYWQYARPRAGQQPLGILSQDDCGVYVGGDWSFGVSIESAYETALALSQAIITNE